MLLLGPAWAEGMRFSCLIPRLTFQLVATQIAITDLLGTSSLNVEVESGPNLTCAFIALSISDANLVFFFPGAFVLIKIYFPLQKQLGYAKSISSVSSLLLIAMFLKLRTTALRGSFGTCKE